MIRPPHTVSNRWQISMASDGSETAVQFVRGRSRGTPSIRPRECRPAVQWPTTRNSGYVLQNTPTSQERFGWLATAIRGFKGEASVLRVQEIDDLPTDALKVLCTMNGHLPCSPWRVATARLEVVATMDPTTAPTLVDLLRSTLHLVKYYGNPPSTDPSWTDSPPSFSAPKTSSPNE